MASAATTHAGAPDGATRLPRWLARVDTPAAAVVLVLAFTVARLLWQVAVNKYTLIEDEAHYWEWARRLDWSYYSEGPGVALVIRGAVELFGNVEWAVRLPAVVAGGVGAWATGALAFTCFNDRRVSFVAAVLYLLAPAFGVTAMLMTIDGPYLACWALACWAAARALMQHKPAFWLVCGLALGVGFLFKYTIVLLVPGLIVSAVWLRPGRAHVKWICLGAILALAGLVPVGVWNAQHDWATVRHLLGHLGAPGGDTASAVPPPPGATDTGWGYSPLWTLEYLLITFVAAGPVPALCIAGRVLGGKPPKPATVLLLSCALSVVVLYLLVSFRTEVEGNWALAGLVSLCPLAAWHAVRGITRDLFPLRFLWGTALVVGVLTALAFNGMPTLAELGPLSRLAPAQRLTGMRAHARAVQAELDRLHEQTGLAPFVMSEHYGRASQLAFYLPGHPTTYCTSAHVGGRKTQYDEWPETDLSNPATQAALLGRPGVLMGGRPDQWDTAFDRVRDLGPLAGEPKANRTTYEGLGYRGFDGWAPGWAREEAKP